MSINGIGETNKFSNLEPFNLLDKLNTIEINDEKSRASILDTCAKYLCFLKDPNTIMTDERAYNVVSFIEENSYEPHIKIAIKSLLDNNCIEIFATVLHYYFAELKSFIAFYQAAEAEAENVEEGFEKSSLTKFKHMICLTPILWNTTNQSRAICEKMHETKASKYILDYLNDDDLQDKCVALNKDNVNIGICLKMILRGLLGAFHNITSIADSYKKDYENWKAAEIILKFSHHFKDDDAIMCAYMALANLFSDNQIETLPDTVLVIKKIIKNVKISAKAIENNVYIKRTKIDIDIDSGEKDSDEVCNINGWHIVELLVALYKISVNDQIKYDMYETYKLKIYLKKIIFHGNDTEKAYSLKLLWQLCFDKRIAADVQKDKELIEFIIFQSKKTDSKRKSLRKHCSGILWSIQEHDNKKAATSSEMMNHGKHIMISYNKESRDLCLKVKQELEKNKFKTWIDVENIYGSSLDGMANAIENSLCILVCMTEKYKQSPNCRAEAEYAFRLNIPIIPLIMQNDYMPDGWLGIILGSKIYINFTKHTFSECIKRLLSEINSAKRQDLTSDNFAKVSVTNNFNKPLTSITEMNELDIEEWTIKETEEWLDKYTFDEKIKTKLYNFTGEMLIQLNYVRLNAPHYYFDSISEKGEIELFDVIKFTTEFEKLFK